MTASTTHHQTAQTVALPPQKPPPPAGYDWGSALLVGALICGYFLPTLVAGKRKHPNGEAILALNLFLGWTFLGWLAALVWAFTNTRPAPDRNQPYAVDDREIQRAIRRGRGY
jgi:hypothetical protein